MPNTPGPAAIFWTAFLDAARLKGKLRQDVAKALFTSPSTISRDAQGEKGVPGRGEVLAAIAALGLESQQAILMDAWECGLLASRGGLECDSPEALEAAADAAARDEDHIRAYTLLRHAWSLRNEGRSSAAALQALARTGIRLAEACANLGRYSEGVERCEQVLNDYAQLMSPADRFSARHQHALCLRLCGPDQAARAFLLLEGLLDDYRSAKSDAIVGDAEISRALRDAARCLIHSPHRRNEMQTMLDLASEHAAAARRLALQQQFHTRLDLAALALVDCVPYFAEEYLHSATEDFTRGVRFSESWAGEYAMAKLGLVQLLAEHAMGRSSRAESAAANWRQRARVRGSGQLLAAAEEMDAGLDQALPRVVVALLA